MLFRVYRSQSSNDGDRYENKEIKLNLINTSGSRCPLVAYYYFLLLFIELLVPNFQIARDRQAQRRCHISKCRGHTPSHPMKESYYPASAGFQGFFLLKQGVVLRRLDRTFVNFNESGNNYEIEVVIRN